MDFRLVDEKMCLHLALRAIGRTLPVELMGTIQQIIEWEDSAERLKRMEYALPSALTNMIQAMEKWEEVQDDVLEDWIEDLEFAVTAYDEERRELRSEVGKKATVTKFEEMSENVLQEIDILDSIRSRYCSADSGGQL
ncbi:MAG: hypothetical protein Q9170_005783 [Blastenia crenularia]